MNEKKNKSNLGCFILIAFVVISLYTCGSRKRIGATCRDGTCSHHNGVRNWKYEYWWE